MKEEEEEEEVEEGEEEEEEEEVIVQQKSIVSSHLEQKKGGKCFYRQHLATLHFSRVIHMLRISSETQDGKRKRKRKKEKSFLIEALNNQFSFGKLQLSR